jgi:hypothetical protein
VDASETIFKFFWIQNAIGAALFLGIAVAAIVQLKFLADQKRTINRNNFANWLLFILIAFIGFERVLYLMLDPYRYRGIIGAVAESILFGLATWGFVCIYLIIIVIWIKMYTSAKNAEQFITKLIKYIFVLMALVLCVQITYDVIRAIYAAGQARTIALIVYFTFAIVASVAAAIIFLVYGRLLYRRLSKFREHDPTRQAKIDKVMKFTTAASIVVISYAVALGSLIAVTLIYGEAVDAFLISHFLQRLAEFGGCLAILITHHININRHRVNITTGNSTNNARSAGSRTQDTEKL